MRNFTFTFGKRGTAQFGVSSHQQKRSTVNDRPKQQDQRDCK